jgi:dihydrofolate synthase/folylpolyglutamate synthase
MKLQKIVSRLQELHPKEIDLSLDRIQNLCQRLGNPQDKLKAISIVGTNGKYSTYPSHVCYFKRRQILNVIFTLALISKILMNVLFLIMKSLMMKN